MLLAYLDESSSDGRYYIGALVIHESNARALTDDLDSIALKASTGFGLPSDVELHAHEIVNAKKEWRVMGQLLRARIGIFEAVLRAIVANHAQLLVEGVHIERLAERTYATPLGPHAIALNFISERVNEFAGQHDELALMIADEVDHRDEHRRGLWVAQRGTTWGYKRQQIDRIVDTLHFAPSHTTRLLQAADVATYLCRRWHAHTETDPRSQREWGRLYGILEPNVAHHRCWLA